MNRSKCVLCEKKIEEIFKIESIPVFMGVVENNQSVVKQDMVVGECTNCGLLQNINLVDKSLVYLNNHNSEIVGETWKRHYSDFSQFILEQHRGGVVLEIGDPSAKLAKNLKCFYEKWLIIEPNTEMENFDNVEIYKTFFEGINPSKYNIEMIVHSHVLEHIYEPVTFLRDCHKILQNDGLVIFSIPNLKWILENISPPTSVLHFEHTYYIDEYVVESFLRKSGFRIEIMKKFDNHSIFVCAKKDVTELSNIKRVDLKNNFLRLHSIFTEKIYKINELLGDSKYYLFSAHITSQYLLQNGISSNIIGLLDNSKSKIGKKLYGYDFDIYGINEISNKERPIVIASHMGAYYTEIKEQLVRVNERVIVL